MEDRIVTCYWNNWFRIGPRNEMKVHLIYKVTAMCGYLNINTTNEKRTNGNA